MLNRLIGWVDDFKGRQSTVQDFNKRAKNNFVEKKTSILLEAKTTIGCAEFKHSFSKFMAGGFSVGASSSVSLKKEEVQAVGLELIKDETFVRKLISLGWDTLEVHDSNLVHCFKWQLDKHIHT